MGNAYTLLDGANANVSPLALISVSNFASRSGWSDLTEPTGGLTPVQSHVTSGTSVILKAKSITDFFDNALTTSVGVVKLHNQRAFTASFAFTGFAGQTAINATKYWKLFVGQVFGSWGTQGSWNGAMLVAINDAGDKWYALKRHKLSQAALNTASSATQVQVALAPVLTSLTFQYEWAEGLGYKVWAAWNGGGLVELGGGAVPTGYVDSRAAAAGAPGANTTSPMLGSRHLVVLVGNNEAQAASNDVKLDSLTVTGAS